MNKLKRPWYKKVGACLLEALLDVLSILIIFTLLGLVVTVPVITGKATEVIFNLPTIKIAPLDDGLYISALWVVGAMSIALVMIVIAWVSNCWNRANNQ